MKSIRWTLHHSDSGRFGFRSFYGRVQFRKRAVRGQVTQLALDDLWRVLAQIMRNGLDANLDSTRRLVGVQIAELKVDRSRGLDNLLRWCVCGVIHPALVTGMQHHACDPGASCRKSGAPDN